ncbi:DeoR family transcriptional regulator [Streptomyces sp. NPDC088747]|uniref:DeoR family transcriptional regulator n=1 Tax=Streptomyces sp. NPDC088747 TaxID=3365886 RepID=UPI0037F2039B
MSRATRLIVVAHLTERHMTVPEIAAELGVSKETVRRDLHNPPPAAEPETPPNVAPDEPPVSADPRPGPEGVTLPPSEQLGKDLRLLAASYKGQPEDIARLLIHQAAEAVRTRMAARFAAAEAQGVRS